MSTDTVTGVESGPRDIFPGLDTEVLLELVVVVLPEFLAVTVG